MKLGLIIRLVLAGIAILFIALYQLGAAKDEMYDSNDKTWIVFKRIGLFLFISLVTLLIIFAAGGGETQDIEPRRWEYGRG